MIVFRNPGIIDLDAALTMGVSVKEGDSPIGYFGTGLKFAVATILRNGGSVILWRGQSQHRFEVKRTTIRGEEFDLVMMDGERLGFTTQLGRNWLPWMAFREMASNCRDEGGSYMLTKSGNICADHAADHTTLIVEGLDDVWPDRHSILLESAPIAVNDIFEVHEGASLYVFYRGVRIYQSPRPLAFTYNITEKIDITEDRSARSWFDVELKLERGIGQLDDAAMLRRMLTCGELFQEHHLDVPAYGHPGAAFGEAARAIAMGPENATKANPAAVKHARASAIDAMQPGDGMALSAVQLHMLQRAKWMLTQGGFEIDAFPVICCDTLGPNIHGLAKDGKIFLAASAFDKGTRELAATIFEEFAHLKSGQSDCTRGFQNWLIDRILIAIETTEREPF